MPYTPILATLAYVLSKDKSSVLMVHRNKNPNDHHWGKYNGLGGKFEVMEDAVSCCIREIKEEAGIDAINPILKGTISWPGFGKNGEAWFGFLFLLTTWNGVPFTENPEGTLEWVPVEQILHKNLWEGDRLFLPLMFDGKPTQFHGVMPYADGKPLSWNYHILGS